MVPPESEPLCIQHSTLQAASKFGDLQHPPTLMRQCTPLSVSHLDSMQTVQTGTVTSSMMRTVREQPSSDTLQPAAGHHQAAPSDPHNTPTEPGDLQQDHPELPAGLTGLQPVAPDSSPQWNSSCVQRRPYLWRTGVSSRDASPLLPPMFGGQSPLQHVPSELVLDDLQYGMSVATTPPMDTAPDPGDSGLDVTIPAFKTKWRGRYCVGPLLGEGAHGKVRLAVCTSDGSAVAVKTAPHQSLAGEWEILRKLRHDHVMPLLDAFRRDDKPKTCFVTPLCLGSLQSVYDCGRTVGARTVSCARRLARELCSGLHYLHTEARVAHLDIKLGNLLVTLASVPSVVISDFGTAVTLPPTSDSIPVTGNATPAYLPPEVASGAEGPFAATKCDVWAAGVVLFALLSLQMPFSGSTESELYTNIVRQPILVHEAAAVEGPGREACADVLHSMLHRTPSMRASAEELLQSDWLRPEYSASLSAQDAFGELRRLNVLRHHAFGLQLTRLPQVASILSDPTAPASVADARLAEYTQRALLSDLQMDPLSLPLQKQHAATATCSAASHDSAATCIEARCSCTVL